MNAYDFLEKLGKLFPPQENEKLFMARTMEYKNLLEDKEKTSKRKLDYEKMFRLIMETYSYKNFPNFSEILKYIRFIPEEKKTIELKGKPREFWVHAFGATYRFIEVPTDLNGTHSLSEFEHVEEITDSGIITIKKPSKIKS